MLYDAQDNVRPNAIHNGVPINSIHNSSQIELYTTDTADLAFTTRGPINTGIWIDWGDGTEREWITHLGISTNVVTSHNYGGLVGTKIVKFIGQLYAVVYFLCTDPLLAGNFSAFSLMTSLTLLHTAGTAINGNINILLKFPLLTYFHNNNINTIGVLSDVSSKTLMTNIRLNGTSTTGDIGDLSTWTLLIYCNLSDTPLSYNSTTLPAWTNCNIQIYSCGLDSTEVDNFLIDLAAAGGTNGTLNIGGTNAARTSASDAAKATLLANGWVVTVNE